MRLKWFLNGFWGIFRKKLIFDKKVKTKCGKSFFGQIFFSNNNGL